MGLNFFEVQQKINRLINNQTELFKKHFELFYDTEKKDVEIIQLDENGKEQVQKLPNYAKIKELSSPVGAIVLWPGKNVPEGWLECNGLTVKRNDYLEVFTIAKKGGEQPAEPFGTGDAVNTFGLPNFQDRALPGTRYIIRVK